MNRFILLFIQSIEKREGEKIIFKRFKRFCYYSRCFKLNQRVLGGFIFCLCHFLLTKIKDKFSSP